MGRKWLQVARVIDGKECEAYIIAESIGVIAKQGDGSDFSVILDHHGELLLSHVKESPGELFAALAGTALSEEIDANAPR